MPRLTLQTPMSSLKPARLGKSRASCARVRTRKTPVSLMTVERRGVRMKARRFWVENLSDYAGLFYFDGLTKTQCSCKHFGSASPFGALLLPSET